LEASVSTSPPICAAIFLRTSSMLCSRWAWGNRPLRLRGRRIQGTRRPTHPCRSCPLSCRPRPRRATWARRIYLLALPEASDEAISPLRIEHYCSPLLRSILWVVTRAWKRGATRRVDLLGVADSVVPDLLCSSGFDCDGLVLASVLREQRDMGRGRLHRCVSLAETRASARHAMNTHLEARTNRSLHFDQAEIPRETKHDMANENEPESLRGRVGVVFGGCRALSMRQLNLARTGDRQGRRS
jgi:hypothetical protein